MGTYPPEFTPRIPKAVNGIQVNFCKNPLCLNFGRPASMKSQPRGPGASGRDRDSYKLSGASRARTYLVCNLCGEMPPLKSNLAISEELDRLSAYLVPKQIPSCPTESCQNHSVGILVPKAYYSFGKTKSGSQRYRCRKCETTFAVGGATLRQKKPEVNEAVFKLLVNKMPFNRIMEVADISASTLYSKINFIHRQCLAFAAVQERRLPDLSIRRLYLSVDRQDHVINWKRADEKCNVILTAVGCADNKTSYVFGIHANYDDGLDAGQVERDALKLGDDLLRPPLRRYARVWRVQDYKDALLYKAQKRVTKKYLQDSIQEAYDNSYSREDIEMSETPTIASGLPYDGMQVHSEYTLYAHFLLLRRLLGHAGKIRFFLDQDSGIRAACLSAFWIEVLEKRCDAFYVRVNKELTINQKRRLKAKSTRDLADFRASSAAYEPLTDYDLRHIVIKEQLKDLVDIGKWHDRWLFYPFPDMSEPEKAICWLTDLQDRAYDDDHLAWLYSKATIHGIDRFFMQARRRLSLLERPISSASNEGRKWHGYSPYNPAMVGKLLDIFRVFYNYIEVGDDKRTPAMRLGLAEIPTTMCQVLNSVHVF
jgi:transposase-like protein